MKIGVHLSFREHKISDVFDALVELKINSFQFFTKSVRASHTINKPDSHMKEIRELSHKHHITPIIHSSYKINLANDYTTESWWIKELIADLKIAEQIKALGCVLHMGKYLQLPRKLALNNMKLALTYVLEKTSNLTSKIILETSCGAGTEMCYRLSNLAKFIKSLPKKYGHRIGVCVDTCHIFSAGYEIRSINAIKKYLSNFEEKIGLKHLLVLHLNDSKTDKKSHIDRHENLGKGTIGLENLLFFAKRAIKNNTVVILETPNNNVVTLKASNNKATTLETPSGYKKEIKMLRNIKL